MKEPTAKDCAAQEKALNHARGFMALSINDARAFGNIDEIFIGARSVSKMLLEIFDKWKPIETLTEDEKDILIVYPNGNGKPVVMHCYEWCDVSKCEGETTVTQAENVGATYWMRTPYVPCSREDSHG